MALRAASWLSWVTGGRCEAARGLRTDILRLTLGDVLGESVAFIWDQRWPCSPGVGQRSTNGKRLRTCCPRSVPLWQEAHYVIQNQGALSQPFSQAKGKSVEVSGHDIEILLSVDYRMHFTKT